MHHAVAAWMIVLFGLIGSARADSDDVKWIAQCLKDNQDARGADVSEFATYCTCMQRKMSNENPSGHAVGKARTWPSQAVRPGDIELRGSSRRVSNGFLQPPGF